MSFYRLRRLRNSIDSLTDMGSQKFLSPSGLTPTSSHRTMARFPLVMYPTKSLSLPKKVWMLAFGWADVFGGETYKGCRTDNSKLWAFAPVRNGRGRCLWHQTLNSVQSNRWHCGKKTIWCIVEIFWIRIPFSHPRNSMQIWTLTLIWMGFGLCDHGGYIQNLSGMF